MGNPAAKCAAQTKILWPAKPLFLSSFLDAKWAETIGRDHMSHKLYEKTFF